MAAFDIIEGIVRLRKKRESFYIDTSEEAYQSAVATVDKLYPLRAAQLGSGVFPLNIYQPDPDAPDQKVEAARQLDSAIFAKLSMPDWDSDFGIEKTEPYNKEKAIEAVAAEMQQLVRTGLYTREQKIQAFLAKEGYEKALPSPISRETIRYNQSMTAERREKMFEHGLEQSHSKLNAKRRKQKPASMTTPFVRGQKEWRAEQLVVACQHLYRVAEWIEKNPHDNMIPSFSERYDFKNLNVGRSQYAPEDFSTRLAIAIASADHFKNGPDLYVSNDELARAASRVYGLYKVAMQRQKKQRENNASLSTIFKSLI